VLRAYGDVVKDSMQGVLGAIGEARRDDLQVDVSGMDDFDIQDFGSEIQDAQSLLALQIPSETLKQQLFTRIALKYLSDSRQELKARIADEIARALVER
jgi:hypothetical protein